MADYRVFQGKTTQQRDPHTHTAADPKAGTTNRWITRTPRCIARPTRRKREPAEAADAEFGEYE